VCVAWESAYVGAIGGAEHFCFYFEYFFDGESGLFVEFLKICLALWLFYLGV
jgi:hypothetical protein